MPGKHSRRRHQARRQAERQAEEQRRRVQGAHGSTSAGEPDWSGKCLNCGSSPIVPETGLCGPCTFGEAETAGGNW